LTEKTTALRKKAIVNLKPILYGTSNSLEQTFDRFSCAWLGSVQSNQAVCVSRYVRKKFAYHCQIFMLRCEEEAMLKSAVIRMPIVDMQNIASCARSLQ